MARKTTTWDDLSGDVRECLTESGAERKVRADFPAYRLRLLLAEENAEERDSDDDPDEKVREARAYLGSCLSFPPSGKYYQPFACSNLLPCPVCHGTGTRPSLAQPRVMKRREARYQRTAHALLARRGAGQGEARALAKNAKAWRALQPSRPRSCEFCMEGSPEALADENYNDAASAYIERLRGPGGKRLGAFLDRSEDGDVFAVVQYEMPEPVEAGE